MEEIKLEKKYGVQPDCGLSWEDENEDDGPLVFLRHSSRQPHFTPKKPRLSLPRNPKERVTTRIQSLQSSLKSSFEEYCKHFDVMESELHKAKTEKEDLAERNQRVEDELQKTKEQVESYKQNFDQTSNELEELCTTFGAVKEECNKLCKEKEKMGEELEYSRQRVEYYKRIGHLKGALKDVAEFSGLRQILQPKNNSSPESIKHHNSEVSKKRKYVLNIYELDDSVTCSICLEACTESRKHNICSLACGHFFGRSCITQWIDNSGTGSSKCPQCSRSATLKDVRDHCVQQIYVGEDKI